MPKKEFKYKNIILYRVEAKHYPDECTGCYFNGNPHVGCKCPSTLCCWEDVNRDFIFVKKTNGQRRQKNKKR